MWSPYSFCVSISTVKDSLSLSSQDYFEVCFVESLKFLRVESPLPEKTLEFHCGFGSGRFITSRLFLSPTLLLKKGMMMVRCFDCCNLIRSWKPTTKRDWLFEEKWKCKATSEAFEEYYLIEMERECKYYEKRPKLVLQSIG